MADDVDAVMQTIPLLDNFRLHLSGMSAEERAKIAREAETETVGK